MLNHLSWGVLAVYVAVFVLTAYREGQFQWLWGSICLWLGLGILGAKVAPGVVGITYLSSLPIAWACIAVGSLFFFVNHWKKLRAGCWHAEGAGFFISLLAVSSLLLLLAFMVLFGVVWINYPDGISAYALPALLQMFFLEPFFLIGIQLLLMTVFYIHRVHLEHQPANVFSKAQLQYGFLLSLLAQLVWVVVSMWMIRY